MIPRYRSGFCTAIARFAGSIIHFGAWYLGLTPQALCWRALRALYWRRIASLTRNFPPLVFLHGGQSADEMSDYLGTVPEEAGAAVLAANF